MTPTHRDDDPLHRLLGRRAQVHALALRLVGDVHTADDVTQTAMVHAWRRRPEPLRDAGAWLLRVTRSVVAMEARARRRRSANERRAAEQRERAAPSTGELIERAELHHVLVEELLALPEPHRSVLLRRYFDGAMPREIAAQQGLAVSTVSNRLTAAHRALRERLERRGGGAWAALQALVPVASTQKVATLVAGPVLVSAWKLAVGAAALALAAVLWTAFSAPASGGGELPSGGGALPQVAATGDEPSENPMAPAPTRRMALASSTRAGDVAADVRATLRVHVLDAARRPATGFRVVVRGAGERRIGAVDARGYTEIADLPIGAPLTAAVVFGEDVWLEQSLRIESAAGVTRTWTVHRTTRVHGVVRDDDGAPFARLEVMLARPRHAEREFARSVRRERVVARTFTDEAGAFEFAEVAPGSYRIGPTGEQQPRIRADGIPVLDTELVSTGVLEPLEVPRNRPELAVELAASRGLSIEGTVVFPDGTPVDDVLLLGVCNGIDGSLRADTDGDGRFRFGPLEPGTYRILDNAGPAGFGLYQWIPVEAGTTDVRLQLRAGGGIAGQVVDPKTAVGGGVAGWLRVQPALGSESARNGRSVQIGAGRDGGFRMDSLAPGAYALTFLADDGGTFGFLPQVDVAAGIVSDGLRVELQPAARLQLTTLDAQDPFVVEVRWRGRRFLRVSMSPGLEHAVAVPPGPLDVVTTNRRTHESATHVVDLEVDGTGQLPIGGDRRRER